MIEFIILYAIGLSIFMFVLIWYLYCILSRKGFITIDRLNNSPVGRLAREKNPEEWKESLPIKKKRLDVGVTIMLGLFLVPGLFIFAIPSFLDLGYIAFNDIPRFEGIVTSEVREHSIGEPFQHVTIQNDNEELRIIYMRADHIRQGDFIRVQYLPFTGNGARYCDCC